MYSWINRSNFLLLVLSISAMTYFAGAGARGEREEGMDRDRGGGENREGSQQHSSQRAYNPQQGDYKGGYSDYGHSYSEQDRGAAAYGVGRATGENQGENYDNQGNTQYIPYQPQQQQSQPQAQPYPYTEQPYQPQ
jgi:hypothetical protein